MSKLIVFTRIFLLSAAIMATLSCGNMNVKVDELKSFPNAVPGVNLPEFTDRVRTEVQLVGLDVGEKIGKNSHKIYSLPQTATFAEVKRFYDDELQRLGFAQTFPEPVKSGNSQIIYYHRDGFLKKAKIAVAFSGVENYETKKIYPFLTVFIPE